MQPKGEPHFTLTRAARACEDARLAAGSASRLNLPPEHTELVRGAVRDLDRAQGKLFQAENLPFDAPGVGKLAPRRTHAQLSMEVL